MLKLLQNYLKISAFQIPCDPVITNQYIPVLQIAVFQLSKFITGIQPCESTRPDGT